jgi:hypothetical protein
MLTAEAEAVVEVGVGERANTGPTAFLLSKGTSSCSSVLLLYSGQFLKAHRTTDRDCYELRLTA